MLLMVGASAVADQVSFSDISANAGILQHAPEDGTGTGAAAADYDGDGFVDLFIPQRKGSPDRLYRNQGDGTFVDVASSVGLASLESNRTAVWIDYDGDKDLDLLIANDDQAADTSFRLFRQEADGCFADVTVASGVFKTPVIEAPTHHWGGLCAADINGDGYLDFFAAQWPGVKHLFLNTGQGGFVDISDSQGVGGFSEFMNQPAMADFNGDGLMDIFVTVDFGPNRMLINQGELVFQDLAGLNGTNNNMNDMGITFGDYDNDGDLDIYISNIYMPPPPENPLGPRYNVLYRNDSIGNVLNFVDVSMEMGVHNGGFGWGVTWMDADLDGWLDLAATNGWRSSIGLDDPSLYFVNPVSLGGAVDDPFVEVGASYGFDDIDWGSALVAFDLERDGDLDMVQACQRGPVRVMETIREPDEPGGSLTHHYLTVKPRMDGPNHFAIGAIVRVAAGDLTMMRYVTAGIGFMGQEPAEAHFGLGSQDAAQVVRIDWPDGSRTELEDVASDQALVFEHGGWGDMNADGSVSLADYGQFVGCFSGPDVPAIAANCRPADFNGDGVTDLREFAVFQRRISSD